MTKNEFTRELKSKINHLPKAERRRILTYYYEMISERMEDGMSESEAIDALGNLDELFSEYAPATKEPKRGVRLRGWHIVMLIVGSPLWILLVAAMLCIMIAFYIVIWALVICVNLRRCTVFLCCFRCWCISFRSCHNVAYSM
ncbi:MAG: DUF1700 domain-containing protein [Ruminococcus sp.]|nr:DUF1700 domain-containing protein [Ruminococcus sp.]